MVLKLVRKTADLPVRLTHYTTLSGLMGIISSGRIWASNISFLNDHRELQHGLDAAMQAIEILSSSARWTAWTPALEAAQSRLNNGEAPDTYAACFCVNSDLLSQWRGYGGQEQGVSITFNRARLSRALRADASLYEVVYCDLSAKDKMRVALRAALADADETYDIVGPGPADEREKEAFSVICALAPQFKHYGFKDEREWRYVVQDGENGYDVSHRVSGNVIVPYLALGPGDKSLPIVKVTVGPGRHQDLTAKSIGAFLWKAGYPEVEVVKSKVPFRS
jgi:hypothetical protein